MLCTRCHKHEPIPGKKSCATCTDYARQARKNRKNTGRCQACGKNSAGGLTTCEACRDRGRERAKKIKDSGLCVCGKRKPVAGKKMCESCLAYHRRWVDKTRKKRNAVGLCVCGKPAKPGSNICQVCHGRRIEWARAKRRRLVAAGLCSKCEKKNPRHAQGLETCQDCSDERIRKIREKTYGIDNKKYEQRVQEQEGKCAICKKVPEKTLCVDHDHETGHVRALLCHTCNRCLGLAGESTETLQRMIDYLNEYW